MKYLVFMILIFLSGSFVQAEILFQDPTGGAINAAFESLSEEEVKDLSPPNVYEKKYLLGLLYLNGDEAFRVDQNCEKSFSLLTDAWGADIADAGHALATMYYHGVCTDKDIDKARELATRTAHSGYILSQRMLGMAYLGEKWEKLYNYDVDEGVYWLSMAGNAGDRRSAAHLAGIYYDGDIVKKSNKKYFEWLKKAISSKYEKRNRAGFMAFAKCYERGKGTEVDLVKAYKYYDLSGTAGIESKQRISKKMTQEQIDEALRQSEAWQEEHNIEIGGGFIRRVD